MSRYLQKHISTVLENELLKKPEVNPNATVVTHPPIYVLCAVKDSSLSNIRKNFQPEFCVQCHSGTIRNFVECNHHIFSPCSTFEYSPFIAHLFPFLNQCWIEKTGDRIDQEQNEELLLGVTSYFK